MATLPSNNFFLILGIIFLGIAVLGQTKLGFIEINPGLFGRLLALSFGILSLVFALGLGNFSVNFPLESVDSFKVYLAKQVQQGAGFINDFLLGS